MEADTASLRKAAPNWSLAGDKQLLGMLQKIHQKIMTKCEEANKKMDAMVDALDNASIDLQNVNNKFMALSNSQFVESRVYDDDVDVSTADNNMAKVEPPKSEAESEISKLKLSLQRLEQMHEPVHILDSDSSDDEDDGRIILKPREIYSHRPLPYIIGSQAWKSKWHAGLIQEESDSDSSVSKHDNIYNDEYSESEPETAPTDKLANRTISSSSMESEVTSQPQATSQVARPPAKPADIAAELARRLGGPPLPLPDIETMPTEVPPEPTTKKVYRVEKPAPTTVFPDEPPPLDDYQSYKSDYSDDDDIFAELHKKPYPNTNKDRNSVAKNLFGGLSDNIVDDLFGEVETCDNDIGNVVDYHDAESSGREKSPLFDERQGSNLVTEKSVPKQSPIKTNTSSEGAVKKPIGGISLFGTNKGAESIGAAILKRNQRKSSTSDEDTNNTEDKEKILNVSKSTDEPVNKIIEDLFSKPLKKVTKKKEIIREETQNVKPAKDKIDLFSDNLFDDIDDIFTTNIITKPKDNKPQKSIFDDDDLFADVALNKPEKNNDKSDTKSIFDSNENLFKENENDFKTEVKIPSNPINVDEIDMIAEKNGKTDTESDKKVEQVLSKGLFDDDIDDDLFSNVKIVNKKTQNSTIEKVNEAKFITRDSENKSSSTKTITNDVSKPLNNKSENKSLDPDVLQPDSSKFQLESPSLFDEDEYDDLYSAKTKSSTEQSNLNYVEENRHIIDDKKNTETIESIKTIHKEVIPQINNNIADSRQIELDKNTQSQKEILNSHDIIENSNVVKTAKNKSYIPDERVKSKISEEKFADSGRNIISNILDQKEDFKTAHFTDLDDNLKHSETIIVDSTEPQDPLPETSKLESTEPSLSSDIFADMPPEFEKPLEPKKSKNVNALFDDDSDDEALFFKKNEVISDEKPELNFSSDRFRIFHDEPPEIDIDFSQKPSKNTSNPMIECDDEDLLGDSSTLQGQTVEKVPKDSTKEVNKSRQNVDLSEDGKKKDVVDITKLIEDSKESEKNKEINVSKVPESYEERSKTDSTDYVSDKTEASETETFSNKDLIEETEPVKSIGKLKPMNFSINVNTLLPGASLKKSKVSEETDGNTLSSKSNEELNIHSSEKAESKMVKSVSFDGDPDSEILDNKLSKQRAKIQVKRRPSSRRARLEAVRKSKIELTSDSTDNSSSFDEPPYKEIVNKEKVAERKVEQVDSNIIQNKSSSSGTVNENKSTLDIQNCSKIISPPLSETLQKSVDQLIESKTTRADVKSKVVYILNDEDIFNDMNPKKEDVTESYKPQNKKVLDIVDDDDEFLFKTPNISTLGKTYENKTVSSSHDLKTEPDITISKESEQKHVKDKLPKAKMSLFDDLSEDENELFGGSKKPVVQKSNIFDSDNEADLFVKSKRESKITAEAKKETVKSSLFGDESDDDSDLFGVKTVKSLVNVTQDRKKPKEVAAKTSEPVFEDPLSMFGDES